MADLRLGDCREQMAALSPDSVDAIVTDPPYGLSFMGKAWDHGVPGAEFWREALRIAKPGAHLVAFGGSRTYHRLTCAVEDAGWEIRDCLSWLYGSGFPKSLDVSKAIDKAAGAKREVVGSKLGRPGMAKDGSNQRSGFDAAFGGAASGVLSTDITAPATDAAREWQGWGTALKPAWEPIILARKPLAGTVAANFTEHGTGALNIDGCRIAGVKGVPASPRRAEQGAAYGELGNDPGTGSGWDAATGRWPANVVLDEEAAALLDAQSGDLQGRGNVGGASRFFYCAKASRSERNAGLDGFPDRRVIHQAQTLNNGSGGLRNGDGLPSQTKNHHPTVKPVTLMRWLCRLVTPPGGLILDPFCGSGSTGVAASLEGFQFIGIDTEQAYLDIAAARIAHTQEAA